MLLAVFLGSAEDFGSGFLRASKVNEKKLKSSKETSSDDRHMVHMNPSKG
jgi:hypothetical protein